MNVGGENELRENKKTTGEIQDSMKSVSAMLNKHGRGEVYYGVLDDGTVVGQQVSDSSLRDVSRAIRESIEPSISPIVREEILDGKHVIHLIFSGTKRPYSSKGIYYIRVSDEDLPLKQNELFRIMKERSYNDDWETEMTSYTLDDIDDETLERFYNNAKSCGRLAIEDYDKKNILNSLELMHNGYINNACFALFGKNTQISLKLANFATNEKLTFLDLKEIKGNIYNLVDIAIEYILNHISWRVEIGKRQRQELPELPERAIREMVVNAFAHARYNDKSTEHEIDIHPGKITIYNPGPFPDDLTPNDFVSSDLASLKRNPLILDILYRSKDVEKEGSGFKRMNKLMSENGLKWSFSKDSYGFYFTFFRENGTNYGTNGTNYGTNGTNYGTNELKDLSESEHQIYDLLCSNPRYVREELVKLTNKSTRTIQRLLNSLSEKGYITRIGKTKGYWEILK